MACQAINFLTLAASEAAHNSEATDSVLILCLERSREQLPKENKALRPKSRIYSRAGAGRGDEDRGEEAEGVQG